MDTDRSECARASSARARLLRARVDCADDALGVRYAHRGLDVPSAWDVLAPRFDARAARALQGARAVLRGARADPAHPFRALLVHTGVRAGTLDLHAPALEVPFVLAVRRMRAAADAADATDARAWTGASVRAAMRAHLLRDASVRAPTSLAFPGALCDHFLVWMRAQHACDALDAFAIDVHVAIVRGGWPQVASRADLVLRDAETEQLLLVCWAYQDPQRDGLLGADLDAHAPYAAWSAFMNATRRIFETRQACGGYGASVRACYVVQVHETMQLPHVREVVRSDAVREEREVAPDDA